MRRVFVMLLVTLSLAARADALTLRDIVELNRSGLGEEVLLALIQVSEEIYAIDNQTILGLRDSGLSEKVIVAIIRSGRANRTPTRPLEADPAQPAVAPGYAAMPPITVEQSNTQTQTVEVAQPVPVPVFIPVAVGPVRRFDRRFDDRRHKPEPVFWGWGGKQRPDSWSLDPKPRPKPDSNKPDKPNKPDKL